MWFGFPPQAHKHIHMDLLVEQYSHGEDMYTGIDKVKRTLQITLCTQAQTFQQLRAVDWKVGFTIQNWILISQVDRSMNGRDGGTGPADPATAGPMI